MDGISLTFNNLTSATAIALLQTAMGNGYPGTAAATLPDPDDNDMGPVNMAAPAVDSNGLPWDERIHAKTKTVNKDGSWKKGKGVSDELTAQVTAELRARNASPIPTAAAPFAPPVQPGQPAFNSPIPTVAPQQAVQAVTMPPIQPPAPIVQQPAPTPAQPDFTTLMSALQRGMTNGLITVDMLPGYVAEINGAWQQNFSQITDLASRPDIAGWAIQLLQRDNRYVAG